MRIRTIVDLLGCLAVSSSDPLLLDQNVIVATGGALPEMGDVSLRLAPLVSEQSWSERSGEEGVLLVHVPVRDVEQLDELRQPPQGVVLAASDRPFEEFSGDFRRLTEADSLLSFKKSQLHAAFLHSYDLQQFVGRAQRIIGNPILITNSDHRVVASAGDFPEDREDVREVIERGYVSDSVISDLERDGVIRDVRLHRHAMLSENPRFGQRWVHSIVYAHHMELGRFDVLESDRRIGPTDLELIDHAGSLAGVLIERLDLAGERVGAGSSVLADLLGESFVNERTMRAQLALTSIPLDESYVMIAFSGQRGAGTDYYRRAGRLVGAVMRNCLWTLRDGLLAVLAPVGRSAVVGYDDYERAQRQLSSNRQLRALLDNNDLRAYVSEPFTDPMLCAGRFGQSKDLLDAVGDQRSSRIHYFWNERLKVLAYGASTFDQMDAMLDKRVVAMSVYDRDHGTDYLRTAVMSVSHPGSPSEAAQALNVHRNTYFYRVNKVKELFYLDLKDGDDRLSLAFSARIMEGLRDCAHIDVNDYPMAREHPGGGEAE